MRILDSIARSSRSLRQAKLRTILTMLAISVGSFALALTLAAGEGARQFVDRLVTSNFDPKTILVSPYTAARQGGTPIGSDAPQEHKPDAKPEMRIKPLSEVELQKIAAVEDVARVVPLVELDVQYVSGPNGTKFDGQVNSTDQGVKYEALAGTIPSSLQPHQAILPEIFAGAFGLKLAEEAIGKQLTIQFAPGRDGQDITRSYEIVAVAKKPNGLMGGARNILLSQAAMLEVHRLQSPSETPLFNSALIFATTTNPLRLKLIESEVTKLGYQTVGARELAEQITQAVNIVQYFVAGFGLIALVVSIFGIVNTQLISVLERTREIGLMKALGMRSMGVLRLFVLESVWIGFGGGVIGIFMACLTGVLTNPFINKKLALGSDLLVFVPAQIGGLLVCLMLIAAIAGLLPAWKAARLNPIEALRTE